jgi:alkylation response protein AidB-like acyl-CoA dehydrogenase
MSINTVNTLEIKQTHNREELLKKAKEIGLLAEKHALKADADAKLPDEVIEKIKEAGFPKLLRPKEYGGQDLDYFTLGDIVKTVGYHSTAAAWLTYFFIIHETWASFLPKEGRDELFLSGGLMADVLAPVGKVSDDEDGIGYRLTGQWNFCSGAPWSEWIALGAVGKLRDAKEPEYSLFIVHRDDLEILNNWDTLGLRGSASNGVSVENVYIPPHRIFHATRVMNGEYSVDGNYDPTYQVFKVPFVALFLSGFQFVALGGVKRLLDIFKEKTEQRIRIFHKNQDEKQAGSSQRLIAELSVQYASLEGLAKEYVERLTYYQENEIRVLDEEEREKLFGMRGYVAKTSVDIATRIILALGGNSVYKGNLTEMFVRDLITFAAHPSHHYEDSLASYGRTIFGFDSKSIW